MKKMITIIAAALAMTATVSVQAAPMNDTVNPNWRAEAYGENFKMKAIAGETNMVQTDEDLVYTYVATESCWMEITSENSMDAYVDIYNSEGIELYYGDDITDENDESLSADFRAVCWMEAGETYEFSFHSMEEDETEYQVNIRKAELRIFQHIICHRKQCSAVGQCAALEILAQKPSVLQQCDGGRLSRGFKSEYQHSSAPSIVIFLPLSESFSMLTFTSSPKKASETFSLHSTTQTAPRLM